MPEGVLALLRRLDRLRSVYGPGASAAKRALLSALERRPLPRAGDVRRLHEILCFCRAYPDDASLLAVVERLLGGFDTRRDVRRHREALCDSGIAGTPIHFRFFQPTASWLARRLGDRLTIDWKSFKHRELLDRWLPLLSLYGETPGLDEFALDLEDWIGRMKGPGETDAAYLIRRFDALAVDPFVREKLYDELDIPIVLAPEPRRPSPGTAGVIGLRSGRAGPARETRSRLDSTSYQTRAPGTLNSHETIGWTDYGSSHARGPGAFGQPGSEVEPHPTPSRTRAKHPRSPVVYQAHPLSRTRPVFPGDIRRPPLAIRAVSSREGQDLIDLAREATITRSRDLDVFSWGDRNDVRLVECGEGLQFACIGAIPERRLLLEAVYGFLTLKNGVPIGYVLASALFGSSEIAYNVFETYRGGEAARIYGRVLATVRALFGADSFTIYPYQLGDDNLEALRSGAWWFYQKLGFIPRDPLALRTMRRELRSMKARPGHRSSLATLKTLAASNLFYTMGRPREDVIGILSLPEAGLRVTRFLAQRFGSDRERATRECSREADRLLGLRTLAGLSGGELLAWERWSPLVLILPGLAQWPASDRRALAEVIRAKGGHRESAFVALFDRHSRLRRAIRAIAKSED